MAAAPLPLANISSNTVLAMRPETVPSAMRPSSSDRAGADTGESATVRPALLSAPKSSTVTQLAASLGSRPAAAASK